MALLPAWTRPVIPQLPTCARAALPLTAAQAYAQTAQPACDTADIGAATLTADKVTPRGVSVSIGTAGEVSYRSVEVLAPQA